jgi:hypothetical protein
VRERAETGEDVSGLIAGRLAKWAQSLIGWYNEWRLRGIAGPRAKAEILLKWVLGEAEHCDTCRSLAGQEAKPARWFLDNGYVPGKPGANLDCGGWNCRCAQVTASGYLRSHRWLIA